ncbi:MAG: sigma factor [Pseudomonadota bacterium]
MSDARAAARAEEVARATYGKLVAMLASRSGDIMAAEDALSEAFVAALRTWPRDGVPERPEAWLMAVAKNRGIEERVKALGGTLTIDSLPNEGCCITAKLPITS